MRVQLTKFKAEHIWQLAHCEGIADLEKNILQYAAIAKGTYAFTAVNEHGRVVCCGGVVEYWAGRGEAWAIFDKNCKKEFMSIYRKALKFLKGCPVKRIEAVVNLGFCDGMRFVQALGFEVEAPVMKSYDVYGRDCSLWVRVK